MSLISANDIELIKDHGVPSEVLPEFATLAEDYSLKLTERGRLFYRLALLLHGMSPDPVEHVRDIEGLRAISLRIKQMRLLYERDFSARATEHGRVPVKARAIVHAVLHGTVDDLHSAVDQYHRCEAAGDNVIPGPFRRKQ